MLLYPIPTLAAPFPDIAFIIKENTINGKNPNYCPFLALKTPFPDIAFIKEEASGCINEEAIGTI